MEIDEAQVRIGNELNRLIQLTMEGSGG